MKIRVLGALLVTLIFGTISCSEKDPSQVRVEEGVLQGKIENGLAVFKGIPFAAPPVGELRWKAPNLQRNGMA